MNIVLKLKDPFPVQIDPTTVAAAVDAGTFAEIIPNQRQRHVTWH